MDNDIQRMSISAIDLPLAIRFIVKSSAFIAHHKHLKPTEGFDFIIPIPTQVLESVHSIIGFVLFYLLVRVILIFLKRWKENGFSLRYIFSLKE